MTRTSSQASVETLFAVYIKGVTSDFGALESHDIVALADDLFLVRTTQTQSELYHAIKRRVSPRQLFVGALSQAPKLKGMAEGSTKWLRSH